MGRRVFRRDRLGEMDMAILDEYQEHCRILAENGNPMSGISLLINQFNLISNSDVYHYTDVGGFISIMQNRELWASHIAFMNDKSEYLHGKDLFRRQLERKMAAVESQEREFLYRAAVSLDDEMSDGFFTASSKDIFSLSFSHASDSLEMWRGYGKNSGIAIGFDRNRCSSIPGMCLIRKEMYGRLQAEQGRKAQEVRPGYEQDFIPWTVLYDDERKLELVDSTIELGLSCYRNYSKGSRSRALAVGNQFLSDMIFYLIPFFKHRGFAGEEECRIVERFVTAEGEEAYDIHYHERGGIVLPYIKYMLMDRRCRPLGRMPIREIVVGPGVKQGKVMESVKYFLEKNGMAYLAGKVRASSIPYIET